MYIAYYILRESWQVKYKNMEEEDKEKKITQSLATI